jgi:hypothetical protein
MSWPRLIRLHGRAMASSRPRVSTLIRAHGLVCCSPNRRAMTVAAAPRCSSAQPSSSGRAWAGSASWSNATMMRMPVMRSRAPVPGPEGGGGQGLPDQPGGIGAAREQPGVEHDVGDGAAGAQRPVRAHGHQCAARGADGALAGVSPWPQRLAAFRASELAAGQCDAGRRGVEDLDHRSPRQGRPRPSRPDRGSRCCSLAPDGGPRNPGGLTARYRHRADAQALARPAQTTIPWWPDRSLRFRFD